MSVRLPADDADCAGCQCPGVRGHFQQGSPIRNPCCLGRLGIRSGRLGAHHFEDGKYLNKPYFRSRYSGTQVQETLLLLRVEGTTVVPVDTVQGVAPSAEDDVVLATAVAGQVDFLVTGDGPFRKVGEYFGVVLLTPREFS